MANKRKSLGRGLGALLGDSARTPAQPSAAPAADPAAAVQTSAGLRELDVDLMQRGRYQPRVDMRKDTLQELADSIKAQGIVQPIAVRPIAGADATQRYEIIAGERRWRAAQLAGLAKVPVVIHDVSDNEAVAMALIENIQREDLNPLEEARALSRLIEEFELTHQEGADAVGRSRASVSNLLRLLELGDDVQQLLEQRKLDMGHARALLGVPAGKQQTDLARQVVAGKLSVRETEKRVRALNAPAKKPLAAKKKDPDIVRLEADLTDKLGASVAVNHGSGGRGNVTIAYNSLDELEGILAKIG
ncbi:MAG: ParB/RepB/Spo0J family partition protein [Pseudomonadota bacterium]